MRTDIWNLLHDGTIAELTGHVPGEVLVRVEIAYLRHMFSQDGDSFLLHLRGCSRCAYEEYGEPALLTDLRQIAEAEPLILDARLAEDEIRVAGIYGLLSLKYAALTLSLDNGQPITEVELEVAATRYWNEWERANPESRPPEENQL